MIEEISISGLGVIDSSTLELGAGLTVITGETGAGKTMVVTALGLLTGGRADTSVVRSGAERARVEGVWRAPAAERGIQFTDEVTAAGGEIEDESVIVARTVAAEGRSRAHLGGASVPVATLQRCVGSMVAVHGQSDQHRLLSPVAQRAALDRFGGAELAATRTSYTALYRELKRVEQELDEVRATARERAREADLLRFGLAEIEAVEPQAGEEDDLAAEESRLGYADNLRAAAELAHRALSGDGSDAESGPDAQSMIASARAHLDGVRDHDEQAEILADRAAEVGYLLADLASEIAAYASVVETDPARLAVVSDRRAALIALLRKYGETTADVLEWSKDASVRLLDLDSTDQRIDELTATSRELRTELAAVATLLSKTRRQAAGELAARVVAELRSLAMPHAQIEIVVRHRRAEPGDTEALDLGGEWVRMAASGIDEVEFTLAANPGAPTRPLAKGASGGELSRVMLALEVALADTDPVPTFVFDEVDAGVGGASAVEIGRRLAALAHHAQVLVVTHLPQVAAYADRHVVVRKSDDGTVTTSGIVKLDDAEREIELSRMLAGLSESDTALAHARELLQVALPERALG